MTGKGEDQATAVEEERLLPPEIEESWCSKMVSWRHVIEGSNRTVWKVFCTCLLVANVCMYFYLVREHRVLILIGALFLLKGLVEIWGQDTPTWICPGGLVLFFVVYLMGLPSVLVTFAICTEQPDLAWMGPYKDAVGFLLFCFGSSYSLWYEVNRFKWKSDINNKGRLHTIGLAKYCIHPNYFGDLFAYTGWTMCAGTTCLLSFPAGMIPMFVFLVIPNSDAYLAQRYSQEWPAYQAHTAPLIPFVTSSAVNNILAIACLVLSCYWGANCSGQCW